MNLPHSPRSGSALLLSLIAAAGLSATSLSAQSVATDPVGAITQSLVANSDTIVSLPLQRASVYQGKVASYSSNVITVEGSPAWTTNQFVRVAGTQPNTYYVQVLSGSKEGAFFTITSNTASSLQINLNGDTLSPSDMAAGVLITVIPYHTLGTVFPAGAGVNGSATHGAAARQTEILIPSSGIAGTNLASSTSYYYYTGTTTPGAGWRKAGATGVLANDDILLPSSYFVVRHNVATATSLTNVGNVQMSKSYARIGTIQNNLDQDNYVSVSTGAPLTLAQLDLLSAGFVGSATHGAAARGDQILVFDNATAGKNKAASASYYYYTGTTSPGAGWRRAGTTGVLADSTVVVTPGEGFVIRKKAAATASFASWSVLPSYLE